MTSTLPWTEKYRPKLLDEIISHDRIISTLKTFINNRSLPHLLFYGPAGSGKTSTIMAVAKQLYGKYYPFMVMELNASDDRGIEVVRNKIKQFVTSKSVFFGETVEERKDIFKLVILDETDAMTSEAQAILRKVVEEYTYNTRFCLICNYIQNIMPALQSRCAKFRFSPLNSVDIEKRLRTIISAEKVVVKRSGLNALMRRSKGDMRKMINSLQAVSMAYKIVNEENVNTCLGYPKKQEINFIIDVLVSNPYTDCYNKILDLKNSVGLSLDDIIQEIHDQIVSYIIDEDTKETRAIKDNPLKKLTLQQIAKVLDKMRVIEYNQSVNTSENIQLAALVGIFKKFD